MRSQGAERLGTLVDGGRDVFAHTLDQHTPSHSLFPVDVVDLEAHRCQGCVQGLRSLVGLENDRLTLQREPHREYQGYAVDDDAEPSQPLSRHECQALVSSELLDGASVLHYLSFLPRGRCPDHSDTTRSVASRPEQDNGPGEPCPYAGAKFGP